MIKETHPVDTAAPRSYVKKIEASGDRWWFQRYPPWASIYAQMTLDRNDGVLNLISGGERLLDLGCGFGDVLYLCRDHYIEKYGVDPVPAMVDKSLHNLHSRALADGFHVTKGSAVCLPYASNFFDTVTLLDVFEHIDVKDRHAALQEILRVLKPGGELILVTPSRAILRFWNVINGLLSIPFNVLRRVPVRIWRFVRKEFTEEFCSKRELLDAVEEAEFQLKHFERVSFYPAPETIGFLAPWLRISHRLPLVHRLLSKSFRMLSGLRILNQKMLIRCVKSDDQRIRTAA